MKNKGIGTTSVVIIMVVVVVAVVLGGYLLLFDGLTGEETVDVDDLSSLKFEFGEVKEGGVEHQGTIRIRNMGDEQNLKVRVDIDLNAEWSLGKAILNRELGKFWVYFKEDVPVENLEKGWYLMTGEYPELESSLVEMRDDVLGGVPGNWKGEEFTIENGQIKIYNIDINPSLDDELFEVENYTEVSGVQY